MSRSKRDLASELGSTIVGSAPIIVLLLTPEGVIEYANPFFEKLAGRSLEDFRGKDWFGTFLPKRDQDRAREIFRTSQSGAPVGANTGSFVSAAGEEIVVQWRAQLTREDSEGFICIGVEVADDRFSEDQRSAERNKLRRSDGMLRESQRLAKLGSWELIISTGELVWSDETYRIFDVDPVEFEASYEAFLSVVHPDDRELVDRAYKRSLETKEDYEIEHRLRRKDGRVAHVSERGASEFDQDGNPIRSMGTVQDITERVLATERQNLLVRELDHRVKNTLAVVRSLANETADQSSSVQQFNDAFLGRINAMVSAHEALAATNWSGLPWRKAIDDILSNYQLDGKASRIEMQGASVVLPPAAASPLCLALHELATNARKHGALRPGDGKVSLQWEQMQDQLRVTWQESGGEPPQEPVRPGLGLALIRGLIEHEIGGRIDMQFKPAGLVATFHIPLADTTKAADR